MASEKNKLSKSFFSLSLVQIANNVLPLITVPYISRIFGPEKFGIINFAASFVAYFVLFISYGFDLSATRKISQDPTNKEHRSLVFCEVLYAQTILFLFSVIVFGILLFAMPQFHDNKQVVIYSFLMCVSALFTQNWLFMAMQDLSKVALFNFISKLLFTFLIFFVVHKNSDYIYQPLLIGIIQIAVALLSFFWAVKRYDLQLIKVPIIRCFAYLWEEKTIFLSLVVGSLYTNSNMFILGVYQGNLEVGYYAAGLRFISIIQTILSTPLSQALYPFIGKAFGESKEKGIETAKKITPLIVMVTLIVGFGLLIVGPFALTLLYGQKFRAAVQVLRILSFMPFILALSNIFGIQIMLNLKMDKVLFRIIVCGAIISICANFFTVRAWGYIATSFNWVLTESFITVALYFVLRKSDINVFDIKYFNFATIKAQLQPVIKKFSRSKA